MRALVWLAGFALLSVGMWHFATWDVDRQILLVLGMLAWLLILLNAARRAVTSASFQDAAAALEKRQRVAAFARANYVTRHGEASAVEREKENPNVWADIANAYLQTQTSPAERS